ncbi:hypothetical protein I3F58_07090 [Streptomyces sp. MUM 203J]|uniref:hypothetical protein n=1 Tax=Streptomyces sp. MUM 203J TaxID=2791990 RepID=UPI001F04135D|nr:hypothetical protein [Streptomyces sp. MUM 203J]MCH0539329.1 hypothetical protein [Streptomyces sp. MUM 203J]
MSDNTPVIPGEVPVFTGNEEVLDEKVKALSGHGVKVATAASDIHTTFGGLRAFYQAPEAEQLFATTKPVTDKANQLSSDMCVIAGALGTYANTIRPLVKRLDELRSEAVDFRTKIADDDKWREDGDLVDENNDRRNAIAEVWTQFQEAERSCHAKIVGLVDGKALKVNDGSNAEGMYGYDADFLKQAESLPWGDAVEESIPWYHVHEHAWEFTKGVFVDGVWGTIRGLGTLVGVDGWDAAGQAWTGLGKLLTGVAITAIPGVGAAYWSLPDDKLPSWLRDSRTAVKETGKALVAWDKWGSNPSRAAGEVTFNVLTTVFTGGAGGAVAGTGKAGAAAKALSLANKAGKAVDPMTYVFKGVGGSVTKIGDIMTGLKGKGTFETPDINLDGAIALPDGAKMLPDGTIHLPPGTLVPEGALALPNDTIKLPENTVTFPPGTVKLFGDGPARYMDPTGNLYDGDGILVQKVEDAPEGDTPTTDATTPRPNTPATARIPERELAGVGARNTENAINLGSDLSDPLRHSDTTPTPRHPDTTPGGTAPNHMPEGRAPNGMPSNDLNTSRGGQGDTPPPNTPHTDGPTTGGRPDNPVGTGHTDSPSTSGHPDGPSTGATHPNTPGTGSLDNLGSGADDAARAADDAANQPPGTGASNDAATGGSATPRNPVDRPSFMLDGDNPYGPPGRLTDRQIQEIQVYRANEEPGYFEDYYKSNGNRKNLDFKDESGTTPPQLTRMDENSPWIRAKDAPEPPKPHYLDPKLIHRGADTVSDASRLKRLKAATLDRFFAIEWDKLAEGLKKDAESSHKIHGTDETRGLWSESRGVYKESHTQMVKETERYGEFVAEHHYIAENHAGSVKQTLHGPKNGNDQFDQVWRRPDGKYVVVEAKSSIDTRLGGRNLPNGRRVSQGSQEYILDIIREMEDRGKTIKSEKELARALMAALKKGELEYVVVKGDRNATAYNGYHYQRFDITKRTLP